MLRTINFNYCNIVWPSLPYSTFCVHLPLLFNTSRIMKHMGDQKNTDNRYKLVLHLAINI